MTRVKVGSASDRGRVRSTNEDAKLVTERVFAVADGMGGHQAGEVASKMAIDSLMAASEDPTAQSLQDWVHEANRTIFEAAAESPELRGMGTTLCALALVPSPDGEDELVWVNVGDSRLYLFRDDELIQLSRDHSLVEDLRAAGQLTDEEAAVHPQRNIVTRALGIDSEVVVDGEEVIPVTGDRYLLCSDGLFEEVDVDKIAATLRRLEDPDDVAAELVRLANEQGGRDNITCVLVDIEDDGGRAVAASAALASEPSGLDSPEPETAALEVDPIEPTRAQPVVQLPEPAPRKRRRFTWRVLAFVLAVGLVLGAAAGAIGWFARNTYFLGFNGDEVAVFRGRPGGLLWFDPEVVETCSSEVGRDDLGTTTREQVESQRDYGSEDEAIEQLQAICRQAERRAGAPATTTTSTTTTTAPSQVTTSTTTPA